MAYDENKMYLIFNMRLFEPEPALLSNACFLCEKRLQFRRPPSGGALTMTPLYWNDEGSIFSQLVFAQ